MSLGTGAWENGRGTYAIQARQGGNHGNLRAGLPTCKQPHQSAVTLRDQWKKLLTSPHTYLNPAAIKQSGHGGARIRNDSQKRSE